MQYLFKNGYIDINFENGIIEAVSFGEGNIICGKVPLFTVKLRSRATNSTMITAFDCSFVSFDGNCAKYTNDKIDASLFVFKTENGLDAKIFVENHTDMVVEWVEILSFGVADKLKDEGGRGEILYPFNEGCIVSNMKKRENSPFKFYEPEYPSLSKYSIFPNMVFAPLLAYMCEGHGVYLAAQDPEAATKQVDFKYEGNAIKLHIRAYSDSSYGKDYDMKYSYSIKLFEGDWFSACELYRSYFESVCPPTLTKIKDTKGLPKWYFESPIVAIYPVRGTHDTGDMSPNGLFPYNNALPYLEDIANGTDSKVMSLLMHWEGTAPWAPPYMWEPYGGVELFNEFLDGAHKKNMLVGLYSSGLGYTVQSNIVSEYNKENEFKKENISEIVCANSDESIDSTICKEQRKGYDLCPACERSRDIVANELSKVIASGIDYFQALDQNHGGGSYFCFSDKHGHPPVPGKWQAKAVNELLDGIEKSEVLIGCESAAAEPFIERLRFSDNRFNLNYYIGLPVPAYAYIYHEYVNNFMGNQICMMLSYEEYNYNYRAAYSFIAGDMLAAVLDDKGNISYCWGSDCFTHRTDKDTSLKLLRNLNGWRKGEAKKYLHTGRMIRPEIELDCQKNSFILEDESTLFVDKLLTSAFECEDGKAQFIVNYNSYPITVDLGREFDVAFDFKNIGETVNADCVEIAPLSCIMIKL